MKKKYVFGILLTVCLCLFLGYCIFGASNHEIDKNEIYGTHLAQVIEENFMGLEAVKTADAEVTFDKALDQYSIEMSLETIGEISEEEIETYKRVLGNYNDFAATTLIINGEHK